MWRLSVFLLLLAIGVALFGLLAGADPEGRGARTLVVSWVVAAILLAAAVWMAVRHFFGAP